jgi:hypothetical protein
MNKEKKIDPEKEKILMEKCREMFPQIRNFRYIINDEGTEIKFTADNVEEVQTNTDSNLSVDFIEFAEKLLNTEFEGISLIDGQYYFIHKFKD